VSAPIAAGGPDPDTTPGVDGSTRDPAVDDSPGSQDEDTQTEVPV